MAEEITKGLVKKKLEELGYPKNPRCCLLYTSDAADER